MRLPGGYELRKRGTYTEVRVAGEEALAAAGSESADVRKTAAAAFAASLFEGAFALGRWEPESPSLDAIPLPDVARALTIAGEWVGYIQSDPLRAIPAADWDVAGSHDPDTWRYRLSMAGPSATTTIRVVAGDVLHFRRGCSPSEPWAGRSPLSEASITASLLADLEQAMAHESGTPRGFLLPIPKDGASSTVSQIRAALATMRGDAFLVPTTTGMADSMAEAPRQDWVAKRLGPQFPAPLEPARASAASGLLSALGVPPALATASADGTARRESIRAFYRSGVLPMARVIVREAAAKLGVDSVLTFRDLGAADVQAHAAALQKLTAAGVTVEDALMAVSL